MKQVTIVTGTRAEYGILKPLILNLKKSKDIKVNLVVTGSHLSPAFGNTFQAILDDGIQIDKKIDILLSSDDAASVSKTMGVAMMSFAEYFDNNTVDMLIILGDRYEMLAIAASALSFRIPIAHLHGGEITEGALDDSIRHAITKLSHLHFVSTEAHRNRVIQLGEAPDTVFNVGALGIDNILNDVLLNEAQLKDNLGLDDRPFALATFHPATHDGDTAMQQVDALLRFCENHPNYQFVFTKANADTDGTKINQRISASTQKYEHIKLYDSLGTQRYLSSLKYAAFVIGNSSSAIIEAPSFKVPTINIGDRQKGRVQALNIVNALPSTESLEAALASIQAPSFQQQCLKTVNPYGLGNSAQLITDTIQNFLNQEVTVRKKFWDLEV